MGRLILVKKKSGGQCPGSKSSRGSHELKPGHPREYVLKTAIRNNAAR